jgi:hypothetical protein
MSIARVSLRRPFLLLCGLLIPAACHGTIPSVLPAGTASRANPITAASPRKLPAAILYALGGKPQTKAAYVQVFDAEDKSSDPKPIYTIAPVSGRGYSTLGVDSENNLFAETIVGNEPAIKMFAPGATKATAACQLTRYASGMYVANGLIYLAHTDSTIEEYAEPIPNAKHCPAPVLTLTDKLAGREASLGLFGVAADSAGNVFDTYQVGLATGVMDKFAAGKTYATKYASLGQDFTTFYLAISSHNDIAAGVGGYVSTPPTYQLAVFPKEARKAIVSNPTGETNGSYLGVGFGKHDTEIFSLYDYPATTIRAYAFDPATGKVGKLLRSFYNLYNYEQQFAVYDP